MPRPRARVARTHELLRGERDARRRVCRVQLYNFGDQPLARIGDGDILDSSADQLEGCGASVGLRSATNLASSLRFEWLRAYSIGSAKEARRRRAAYQTLINEVLARHVHPGRRGRGAPRRSGCCDAWANRGGSRHTADVAHAAIGFDAEIPQPNSHLRGETHSYLRMMAPTGVPTDTCATTRPTRSI
jgi:hypothetical protein